MATSNLQAAVELAISRQQIGDFATAARIYGEVLRLIPDQPDVLHLNGVLLHQTGRSAEGLAMLERARAHAPDHLDLLTNLGAVLIDMGRMTDAIGPLERAVALAPVHVNARANLGAALRASGRREEAEPHLKTALCLVPEHGSALMDLGTVIRESGDAERSEQVYREASCLDPLSPKLGINHATALLDLDRREEAERRLKRALAGSPAIAEGWNNLGFPMLTLGRLPEARRHFRRSLVLDTDNPPARHGLSEIAFHDNRLDDAVSLSADALSRNPADNRIAQRHAKHLIAAGHLVDGFEALKCRQEAEDRIRRIGAPPRWSGEVLADKCLLLCSEEGIGDEILHGAVIPDAIKASDHCVIECDPRLLTIWTRSFPKATVRAHDRSGPKHHPVQRYGWLAKIRKPDVSLEIGGLAGAFRPALDDWDRAGGKPYVIPDPRRTDRFRAELRQRMERTGSRLAVGFSWRSMHRTTYRNAYYSALSDWAPLFALDGVTFVSMQYGSDWHAELGAAQETAAASIEVFDGVDMTNDFEAIFSLAEAVDLIIAPSSTVAQVGGALAKPTWLFHPRPIAHQYRTDRFPGFPNTKSYAKHMSEPWKETFEAMAADLAADLAVLRDQTA